MLIAALLEADENLISVPKKEKKKQTLYIFPCVQRVYEASFCKLNPRFLCIKLH